MCCGLSWVDAVVFVSMHVPPYMFLPTHPSPFPICSTPYHASFSLCEFFPRPAHWAGSRVCPPRPCPWGGFAGLPPPLPCEINSSFSALYSRYTFSFFRFSHSRSWSLCFNLFLLCPIAHFSLYHSLSGSLSFKSSPL